MARPDGQILFSDAQWEIIKDRINGVVSTPNYMNDESYLVDQANQFMVDPTVNRYDYMDGNTPFSVVSGAGFSPAPFNSVNSNNVAFDDIHCAAIVAAATNNQSMATAVLNEILKQANDDKLDFGNGSSKTNATYGITQRWITTNGSQLGDPSFLIVEKMIKHLNSYTILREEGLISLTTGEENRLNDWFYDASEYFRELLNRSMLAAWGSGWRNKVFTFGLNNVFNDTSSFANPSFADVNGNPNNNYVASEGMRYGLVNTRMGYAHYTGLYGLLYNDQTNLDYLEDWYDMVLEMTVWSDGWHVENDRSRDSNIDQGVATYVWANIQPMVLMAVSHKIAKINGLPSSTNYTGNEFFNHTTDKGWDSYTANATNTMVSGVSPTSGGQKNLKLMIDANLKTIQQNYGSNYGWNPKRYARAAPHNLLGGTDTTKRQYIHVLAVANMYYNNPVYTSMIKQESTYELHTGVLKSGQGLGLLGAWRSNNGTWGGLLAQDQLYSDMDGILLGVSTDNTQNKMTNK